MNERDRATMDQLDAAERFLLVVAARYETMPAPIAAALHRARAERAEIRRRARTVEPLLERVVHEIRDKAIKDQIATELDRIVRDMEGRTSAP